MSNRCWVLFEFLLCHYPVRVRFYLPTGRPGPAPYFLGILAKTVMAPVLAFPLCGSIKDYLTCMALLMASGLAHRRGEGKL